MFLKFHNQNDCPIWVDLSQVFGFGIAQEDDRDILLLMTVSDDFAIDISELNENERDKLTEALCMLISLAKVRPTSKVVDFEEYLEEIIRKGENASD